MQNDNILNGFVYENIPSYGLVGRPTHSYRTIVHGRVSGWDNYLKNELNRLCSLPDGWDGYDSPAVKFENAECALHLLSSIKQISDNSGVDLRKVIPDAPYLVPVSGGALQAEWHLDGYFVELFFDGALPVTASFYTDDDDIYEEFSFDCGGAQIDTSLLIQWFKRIYDLQNVEQEAA